MKDKKTIVHNGKIWEKTELHLKFAIIGFNHKNIIKQIALDLLKKQVD